VRSGTRTLAPNRLAPPATATRNRSAFVKSQGLTSSACAQHGEKDCGSHSVCAVGYDDAAKRLLIRNSRGADWGRKGYFTVPYDYVANPKLADDFWTLRAFEGA